MLRDLKTGFGVFQIRATEGYVHNTPEVHNWWLTQIAQAEATDDDTIGQCLVTGEVGPIARLHEPKIKGVFGGQSSGAALVSFNLDAFDSYGKSQSINAPVSEQSAFRYCTALNRLLDPGAGRRLSVGDTSVVYWTGEPSPAEDFISQLFNPNEQLDKNASAEDQARLNQVKSWLDAIAQGRMPEGLADNLDTPFYLLGLAPNAARISVRFWHESTLGKFLENLGRHFADLQIAHGPKDHPHPDLWRLVRETARETKDVPDLLEGALLRAILTGQAYPQMFYTALLRRIRADREVRHVRAAAIKACLNRNTDSNLSFHLDKEREDIAYLLGRLFALIERCQHDALPSVDATVRSNFLASASATPALVFPQLLALNRHHMSKIAARTDLKPGLAEKIHSYMNSLLSEVVWRVDHFPSNLNQRDQGHFFVGYYQQHRWLWLSKKERAAAENEESERETV